MVVRGTVWSRPLLLHLVRGSCSYPANFSGVDVVCFRSPRRICSRLRCHGMNVIARWVCAAAGSMVITGALAQSAAPLPWMNTELTAEQRTDLLIAKMTLEQKVEQLSNDTRPAEIDANRPPGCEFQRIGRHIQGIPELGVPTVRMVNGGTGIRGGDCLPEPKATGLPSTPASAAT